MEEEIEQDLALGREQRREDRLARLRIVHIAGDQPVEKTMRRLAGDMQNRAIIQFSPKAMSCSRIWKMAASDSRSRWR